MKTLFLVIALLLAALTGVAAHWALEHYRHRAEPVPPAGDPRLRFPSGAFLARAAVQRYRALPPHERRALKSDLLASLSDLERWSQRANEAALVCLGERHHDAVRRFIARHVLPRLDYRVLMLETGEDGLAAIRSALAANEQATLLGAPIGGVVRAIGRGGIPPRVVAIDETRAEIRRRSAGAGSPHRAPSREETLEARVLRHWRADSRAVVLIGALHCRDTPGWLFHRLASARAAPHGHGMLAVAVLARSAEAGARLLFYLLEEMGIRRDVLVIPDVARFPRQVQSWLPQVAGAFAGYRSVLLFDDAAP